MSLHDFILEVLLLVIRFLVPILLCFGIAWLKTKLGNENFQKLVDRTAVAVKATEAAMGKGNGAKKKKAVELWLANRLKGVSSEDVSTVIDAIVFEMNKELKPKKEGE